MILGISGGLGTGKSAAAAQFERRGFRRLDSDALIRERILVLPEVVASIRSRFGADAVLRDGSVNRGAVAARIFADDSERIWLEELIHPILFGIWREALAAEPGVPWAVEVPLLFEKALENWFDFTVCVACSLGQQLIRLEKRGLDEALARQRISKQLPLARKIELADFILWNEGSVEFLGDQVDRLIGAILPVPAARP